MKLWETRYWEDSYKSVETLQESDYEGKTETVEFNMGKKGNKYERHSGIEISSSSDVGIDINRKESSD